MSRLRQSLLFFFLLSCASSAFAKDQETFAPSEHVTLGDNVQIRLSANDSGQVGHIFHLPNGLDVSYGDLVAMGDFYEIVDKPIAFGKNEAERRSRFLTAFHSFAQSPSAVSEAKQILAVIHNEKKAVEDAVSRGENPEDVYQKMGKDNNRQYNCITGGGCSPSTWWTQPGRYLNLASSNYDHFGDYAWIAYQTGHQLALEQAILARQTQDPAKLELAYAMNAFATHFLSDRFFRRTYANTAKRTGR